MRIHSTLTSSGAYLRVILSFAPRCFGTPCPASGSAPRRGATKRYSFPRSSSSAARPPGTATFLGPARKYRVSKRGIGATLTKAQAVQTQLDVLADWIAELGENFGITSVSWTGSIYATATPSIVASS